MEQLQTKEEVVISAKSAAFNQLNRVTAVSKCLALTLFITLPFLGGLIGYNYAKSNVTTTPVDVLRVVEKKTEVQVNKKPVIVPAGFMLESTPETTAVNPEQKIYAAGMYIDTAVGCMPPKSTETKSEFTRLATVVSTLSVLIPTADLVTDVLHCWFAGGGQIYFIYTLPTSVHGVGVVRLQEGECGMEKNCSPYGAVEQIWPVIK
jgi:hypothetical protein